LDQSHRSAKSDGSTANNTAKISTNVPTTLTRQIAREVANRRRSGKRYQLRVRIIRSDVMISIKQKHEPPTHDAAEQLRSDEARYQPYREFFGNCEPTVTAGLR